MRGHVLATPAVVFGVIRARPMVADEAGLRAGAAGAEQERGQGDEQAGRRGGVDEEARCAKGDHGIRPQLQDRRPANGKANEQCCNPAKRPTA